MRCITVIADFDEWAIAIMIYCLAALITFMPILIAMMKKVELKPGGDSFNESPHFSDENKKLLSQHYSRIQGTLIFWKNKAEWNKRFHYYVLCWTLPISIIIPAMLTFVDLEVYAKLFLTIMSLHSAVMLGFHRALKVENNFKAFRYGESEFYDLYRRLLDRPTSFGDTEEEQIESYFVETEIIRKYVRAAETDNFPTVEDRTNMNTVVRSKKQ